MAGGGLGGGLKTDHWHHTGDLQKRCVTAFMRSHLLFLVQLNQILFKPEVQFVLLFFLMSSSPEVCKFSTILGCHLVELTVYSLHHVVHKSI